MKLMLATLTLVIGATCVVEAGAKMSDAEIKQELLGCWKSPRHGYQYTSNGVIHMLGGITTNHKDVRNGVYYEESDPFDIVTLTTNKFVWCDRGHDHATYTLQRITQEEAARY